MRKENNTHRWLVLLLMLISCSGVMAQRYLDVQIRRPDDNRERVRLGVRAGLNISDLTSAKGLDVWNGLAYYNLNGEYIGFTDTKSKLGLNAGVVAQRKLFGDFFLQASFIFSTKGYELSSQDVDINAQAYYMQVPIEFMYKFPAGRIDLLASVGGFFGIGVGGYTTFEDHYGEDNSPRDYHEDLRSPRIDEEHNNSNLVGCDYTVHGENVYWADEDNTFQSEGTYRIDAGIQLGLGIELWRLQFMINYQLSLTYLYNYAHDFSARYDERAASGNRNAQYGGLSNSFEFFNMDVLTSPHQHVLSFTVSYFLDNIKSVKL